MGNLRSVQKCLYRINTHSIISSKPEEVLNASKIILPGVGHFKKAVENLQQSKLWDVINEAVLQRKTPILGICLGLQLMTKRSEEGDVDGFGWFDAEVVHFDVKDKLKHKVPHMGWNNVHIAKSSNLLNGLPNESEFYFVHSYHIIANKSDEILTTTNYEYDFVSGLEKENIFGLQFHPEKSHDVGEKLLSNFLKL